MPKQGKTPKKKSKEKTPQKSGESEYPAMDQEELNRLVQNAIEQSQPWKPEISQADLPTYLSQPEVV